MDTLIDENTTLRHRQKSVEDQAAGFSAGRLEGSVGNGKGDFQIELVGSFALTEGDFVL